MRALMTCLMLALAACSVDPVALAQPEPAPVFSLSPAALYVNAPSDTGSFAVVADRGEVPQVTWSTRNANVFTVDASGHITATGYGLARVEAQVGDTTLTAMVYVGVLP